MITKAWDQPFHASSNYARAESTAVAFAASMGWISTIDPNGTTFSRLWHVTAEGLIALRSR